MTISTMECILNQIDIRILREVVDFDNHGQMDDDFMLNSTREDCIECILASFDDPDYFYTAINRVIADGDYLTFTPRDIS